MIHRISKTGHATSVYRELEAAVRRSAARRGLTGGHCLSTVPEATTDQQATTSAIASEVKAEYDPAFWDLIERMARSIVITSEAQLRGISDA